MNDLKACIIQRDRTVLLECGHPGFEAAREKLSRFAELVKSPSAFHTYRITPLSLWNAAAMGFTADDIARDLEAVSRWGMPAGLLPEIRGLVSRYGKLCLQKETEGGEGTLCLTASDSRCLDEALAVPALSGMKLERISPTQARISAEARGRLKQELMRSGFPVLDLAGYHTGQALRLEWRQAGGGKPFALRSYQEEAVAAFEGVTGSGGSGVLVLPCGAGKTIIGIAALERQQCECLILTSNTTSVEQWIRELTEKTTLDPAEVGQYAGERKEVKPVTVATYQILTHRRSKDAEFEHMRLFNERNWGLIIYDEVHLLPAPVFRATADIQATRRLGLTATLVREDGCEEDVFSLIGPKRYEMPWKELEAKGWIARVECSEIRVPMEPALRDTYSFAAGKEKFRLAAENPAKTAIVKDLLKRHPHAGVLVIGQYLDQLQALASAIGAPLITGRMPQRQRADLYASFRKGETPVLVVSKVANFAVDLPDASVAIEVSGSFGSRQEEAQRLGRLLRPKSGDNRAFFYTLVTEGSKEEEFAVKRQMFLIEQGYEYTIHSAREVRSGT
ncbi:MULTISPECIES: DNA repair helicase XPB [Paenibacillus]|uniref:DNA 3'-5' helicase n=1 Tax=Paenibacillus albilobatus TaxID=2716884 RepID=A0A919XDD4_9BACL|nr:MULTISPECIES: DNA repair helicase XPB [Paenibacillus]MDR9852808.1 helicase-associated domain-containing protein [Paenibacillus sp. VCA1]GIO30632.1 helicase [Paenibacillus albilobatus]